MRVRKSTAKVFRRFLAALLEAHKQVPLRAQLVLAGQHNQESNPVALPEQFVEGSVSQVAKAQLDRPAEAEAFQASDAERRVEQHLVERAGEPALAGAQLEELALA